MAFLEVRNVKVSGISACCPRNCEDNVETYAKWGGYENFVGTTGIARRRVSAEDICSSDLCIAAAEKLIAELGWEKETIDAVVFVSQTPDYIVPATSPIIQDRMGLSKDCFTLDISLGCSGWVYAMSVIAALLQNGTMKRGLLMAGDTPSKMCSVDDKSTYPLFGDAGTVTALEFDEKTSPMAFVFNTDGSGKDAIIMQDGGRRNPATPESFTMEQHEEGIVRSRMNVEMDGMSVFSFAISKAPKSVNSLLEKIGKDRSEIDCYTFHQANLFLNEKIRKKLKLDEEKVPYCLENFGNTSCASIPLTLVTERRDQLLNNEMKHIGCGFGIGLSWASVYFETDRIACPELVEI